MTSQKHPKLRRLAAGGLDFSTKKFLILPVFSAFCSTNLLDLVPEITKMFPGLASRSASTNHDVDDIPLPSCSATASAMDACTCHNEALRLNNHVGICPRNSRLPSGERGECAPVTSIAPWSSQRNERTAALRRRLAAASTAYNPIHFQLCTLS
jgi:hypothetical protein